MSTVGCKLALQAGSYRIQPKSTHVYTSTVYFAVYSLRFSLRFIVTSHPLPMPVILSNQEEITGGMRYTYRRSIEVSSE